MATKYCPACNQDNHNPLAIACSCTGQPVHLQMRPVIIPRQPRKRCVCGGDHDPVNPDGSVCGNMMDGGIFNIPSEHAKHA